MSITSYAVEEAEREGRERYRRYEERNEKMEEVRKILLIAGVPENRRDALAESVTSLFIEPVRDPYY